MQKNNKNMGIVSYSDELLYVILKVLTEKEHYQ